jgi:3-oxoacyl-[acyl-carrier-protein] synthase-1
LRLPEQAITATYCDLNGQRYRNEEFVYALLRTQESFVDAHDYECPADCWGDVGAASGPLFASLAIRANERGYSKGRFPLAWAGSNAGYRSAMVLELTPH